jgi:hypothetical protein
MAQVPTGTLFFIASAYATGQATTGVSNASEAVVTAAAHGYANGDLVEMTSNWGRIDRRNFRVKGVTANTFILEGQDTTNLTFFPTGGGLGSVRKITTFTQITQVVGVSASGGDPKNADYKYVESDVGYSINDGFAATNYALDLDADAISTAGYAACKLLTEVQTDTCMKMVTRNGGFLLQPCTVALNESVSIADGQINKVKVAFNGKNRLTRYAS